MLKNRRQNVESLLVAEVRDTLKLVEKMLENCHMVAVEIKNPVTNYKKRILREELEGNLDINATLIKNNFEELEKTLRRSVIVKIKEEYKIAEGQITGMSEFYVQLKTADMESRFEIGSKLWEEIQKEKVTVGDVVKIYKDTGFVIKTGRALAIDNTNVTGDLIKIPTGEILKNELQEIELSLDQIDHLNISNETLNNFYSNAKVPKQVQIETNNKVARWLKEEKVSTKFMPLSIKNSELLDYETFIRILQASKFQDYQNKLLFIFEKKPEDFFDFIPKINIDTPNKEEITSHLEKTLALKNIKEDPALFNELLNIALQKGLKISLSILEILSVYKNLNAGTVKDFISKIY